LAEILNVCLNDRCQAWTMDSEGVYSRATSGESDTPESSGTHRQLMELTLQD
jgi:polyphosphate kinase